MYQNSVRTCLNLRFTAMKYDKKMSLKKNFICFKMLLLENHFHANVPQYISNIMIHNDHKI